MHQIQVIDQTNDNKIMQVHSQERKNLEYIYPSENKDTKA